MNYEGGSRQQLLQSLYKIGVCEVCFLKQEAAHGFVKILPFALGILAILGPSGNIMGYPLEILLRVGQPRNDGGGSAPEHQAAGQHGGANLQAARYRLTLEGVPTR